MQNTSIVFNTRRLSFISEIVFGTILSSFHRKFNGRHTNCTVKRRFVARLTSIRWLLIAILRFGSVRNAIWVGYMRARLQVCLVGAVAMVVCVCARADHNILSCTDGNSAWGIHATVVGGGGLADGDYVIFKDFCWSPTNCGGLGSTVFHVASGTITSQSDTSSPVIDACNYFNPVRQRRLRHTLSCALGRVQG